jgi:hypothetical protein
MLRPLSFAGEPQVNPPSREKYLGTRAVSRPHIALRSRGYLPRFTSPGWAGGTPAFPG